MYQKNVVKKNMSIFYKQEKKKRDIMFLLTQSVYQKNVVKKNVSIFYKQEKKKRDIMFLLKTLTISCMMKICRYCLQTFSIEEILKNHIKDCFKINGKQRIIMPKKAILLNSKIIKEK